MAATTGLSQASIASITAGSCGSRMALPKSRMSEPATKVFPAPISIMADTFGSVAAAPIASNNSLRTFHDPALTGGLSMIRTATFPSASRRTLAGTFYSTCSLVSAPMEDGGAFFDNCTGGFAGVFGVHQLRAVTLFPRVAFFDRQKLDLVESRFAEPQAKGRLLGDHFSQLPGSIHQSFRCYDLLHEPDVIGFLGGDRPSGEEHFAQHPLRYVPADLRAGAAAANGDPRHGEGRTGSRNSDVADRGQHRAA